MNTKDLIANGKLLKIKANNTNEFFSVINNILLKDGLVNTEFLEAIEEREKTFPTGIVTSNINIALPHVDAQYVKTNALLICQNNPAIEFRRMDNPSEKILVKLAFVLLIQDPKLHVSAIADLTKIWKSKEIMEKILGAESVREILEVL